MSKAGKQSVALLAMVTGMMKTVVDFDMIDEEMSIAVYAHEVAFKCTTKFPITNDNAKNNEWIQDRVRKFDAFLVAQKDLKYHAILITNLALTTLTDLTEKIRDKDKLEMIEPVIEAVQALYTALDSKMNNDAAYELTDALLNKAYSLIGFERD